MTAGHAIPLSDFFVEKPVDSVRTINDQPALGKNLLFTPVVYDIDRTIAVKRADTIVLGLGVATLTAVNGAVPLSVAGVTTLTSARRATRRRCRTCTSASEVRSLARRPSHCR